MNARTSDVHAGARARAHTSARTHARGNTLRGEPQRSREEEEKTHVRAASAWTKMAGDARADWPSRRGEGVENARSTVVNRSTIKIRIPGGAAGGAARGGEGGWLGTRAAGVGHAGALRPW